MLRPKEVCEHLGVSSATLRRWSDTFSEFLSPTAGKSIAETGGAAQRRYVESDVVVLSAVKKLLDDGNTYEETARKLPELIRSAVIVEHDNMPVPVEKPPTEAIVSGSVHALEAYREAIASKDQTIQAMQETISFQKLLLEDLMHRPAPVALAAPQPAILPPMTLRQRLDWLVRGRIIGGTRENRLADPEGSAQRLLPIQESA